LEREVFALGQVLHVILIENEKTFYIRRHCKFKFIERISVE
jgi:hypothetical protein